MESNENVLKPPANFPLEKLRNLKCFTRDLNNVSIFSLHLTELRYSIQINFMKFYLCFFRNIMRKIGYKIDTET